MVIHLPESILLIFSAESSNFSQFLMECNSTAGWFPLKSPSVAYLPESILLIFSAESSNFSQFLMECNSTAGWFPLKSPSVAFIPLLKHANHLHINVELYYS